MKVKNINHKAYFVKLEQAIMHGNLERFAGLLPYLAKYGKTEIRFFTRQVNRPGFLYDDFNQIYCRQDIVMRIAKKPKIYLIILEEVNPIHNYLETLLCKN